MRSLRALLSLLVGLFLLVPAGAAAEQTVSVEPAATVSWDEMLLYEQLVPRAAQAPAVAPKPPDVAGFDLGPPEAPTSTGGPRAPLAPPEPPALAGPSVTTSFSALPDNNTSIPPDTMGAAGPNHLVTMLNTEVRIQNRSGGVISTVSLSTFWTAATGLSGSPFDPRVLYDASSGRWFATVDADGNLATSQVWFAVSMGSDPTLGWTFYSFVADGTGATWADFPGFGFNGTWIAITNNMFTVSASPSFAGAKMWVIDKASALAGGALTATIFPTSFDFEPTFGTFGAALQPAVTFGAQPKLYLVDSTGFTSGSTALLRLSEISGTGPSPTWAVTPGGVFAGTGMFLAPAAGNFTTAQIGAEQSGIPSTCDGGSANGAPCLNTTPDCDSGLVAGTCRRIDTGNGRISTNSIFRNGRVWAVHSGGRPVGAVDRTSVMWYQLDPASMPAPIVQSGVLEGVAGVHHFYPSIAVNQNDDVCLGFSRSDSSKFIEAVTTGRFGTDAAGAMDPISVLKSGEDSYYKKFSGSKNRWGDYSATMVDPVDDSSFWTLQEYAAFDVGTGVNDDRWGTWWGHKQVGAPPTTTTSTTLATTTTTSTTVSTTTTTLPTAACSAAPQSVCLVAARGKLQYNEKKLGKEKMKLLWKNITTATTQGDFGNPVNPGGTSVALCIYDDANTLVEDFVVDRAGQLCAGKDCWKAKGTKGYGYKDKDSSSEGVSKIGYKSGVAGKGKSDGKGKNNAAKGQTSLPTGVVGGLTGSTAPTIQMVTSDGFCVGATMNVVKKDDGVQYKAQKQ